jgi:hypothetical protein
VGYVLKRRQLNYYFGEPNLALLRTNLNYIFTIEITLRGWEGTEHCTVTSGFAMTGVKKRFLNIVPFVR